MGEPHFIGREGLFAPGIQADIDAEPFSGSAAYHEVANKCHAQTLRVFPEIPRLAKLIGTNHDVSPERFVLEGADFSLRTEIGYHTDLRYS